MDDDTGRHDGQRFGSLCRAPRPQRCADSTRSCGRDPRGRAVKSASATPTASGACRPAVIRRRELGCAATAGLVAGTGDAVRGRRSVTTLWTTINRTRGVLRQTRCAIRRPWRRMAGVVCTTGASASVAVWRSAGCCQPASSAAYAPAATIAAVTGPAQRREPAHANPRTAREPSVGLPGFAIAPRGYDAHRTFDLALPAERLNAARAAGQMPPIGVPLAVGGFVEGDSAREYFRLRAGCAHRLSSFSSKVVRNIFIARQTRCRTASALMPSISAASLDE